VGRTALAEGIAVLDAKHGYNFEHRHSAIRYVTPAPRHAGQDQPLLAARHVLYTEARQLNPARWSGNTRDRSYINAVTLNPERDSVITRRI
jgi:putative transposase